MYGAVMCDLLGLSQTEVIEYFVILSLLFL